MQPILQLEPAQFDFFTKIFTKVVTKSPFDVCIVNSKLQKKFESTVLFIDFTNLFNNSQVNLKFLDPRIAAKVLKSVKTDEPVTFFEDVDKYLLVYQMSDSRNKKYTFTFTILKTESCSEEEYAFPNKNDLLDGIKLDKDIFDSIGKLAKSFGTEDIYFLLDENNKIKAISIGDDANIELEEGTKISKENAAVVLKSTSLLIFDAEEIDVEIYKDSNGTYSAVYSLNVGFPIDFKIHETLVNTEDELEL